MGDAAVGERPGAAALRIDAALLALLWLGSLAGWAVLPDRFPIHFDFAGNADGWAARDAGGFVLWLLLPAIATLTSVFMRWAPRAARGSPALWNVPHKQRFLALEPAAREPVHAELAATMAVVTALTTGLLVLVQVLVWMSARGARVPAAVMLAATIGYCAVTIAVAIRGSRRAGVAIERAAGDSAS